MVDNFALALTHGLLALAAWRLMTRVDLDSDARPASDTETTEPKKRGKSGFGA